MEAVSSGKVLKKCQPKGGSRKGSPNKVTKELRSMILEAVDNCGGVDYLERRANDPKTATAFLALLGKVLPLTLAGKVEFSLQAPWLKQAIADRNK